MSAWYKQQDVCSPAGSLAGVRGYTTLGRPRVIRKRATRIAGVQPSARLSTRGEQRVFPEARHNLLLDRPKDVLEAIRDVVDQTRPLR